MQKQTHDFSGLLKEAKLKATPKRIALLELLAREHAPLSIAEIGRKALQVIDPVTIYRALDALVAAHIVSRVDFHEREARYEIIAGRTHHHHAVCVDCGVVEDIAECGSLKIESAALRNSKRFAEIQSHALEFFGRCKSCINK